jgi:hypothetical protein
MPRAGWSEGEPEGRPRPPMGLRDAFLHLFPAAFYAGGA